MTCSARRGAPAKEPRMASGLRGTGGHGWDRTSDLSRVRGAFIPLNYVPGQGSDFTAWATRGQTAVDPLRSTAQCALRSTKEIEIAALVGLKHVIRVEPRIPARGAVRRWLGGLTPAGEFGIVDKQIDAFV